MCISTELTLKQPNQVEIATVGQIVVPRFRMIFLGSRDIVGQYGVVLSIVVELTLADLADDRYQD